MPKSIRILGWLSVNAIRFFAFIGVLGWTYNFLYEALIRMSFSQALATSLVGLAATLWLGIGVAYAIEFYLERSKWADEGNRVADVLVGMRLAGNPVVDAHRIVNVWFSDQPPNEALRVAIKTGLYARRRWLEIE